MRENNKKYINNNTTNSNNNNNNNNNIDKIYLFLFQTLNYEYKKPEMIHLPQNFLFFIIKKIEEFGPNRLMFHTHDGPTDIDTMTKILQLRF